MPEIGPTFFCALAVLNGGCKPSHGSSPRHFQICYTTVTAEQSGALGLSRIKDHDNLRLRATQHA